MHKFHPNYDTDCLKFGAHIEDAKRMTNTLAVHLVPPAELVYSTLIYLFNSFGVL